MSQAQWKKFPFFETAVLIGDSQAPKRGLAASPKSQMQPEEVNPEDVRSLSDLPKIAFVVQIMGVFYVAVQSGRIYVCTNNDIRKSFDAHSSGISFLQKSRLHPVLST